MKTIFAGAYLIAIPFKTVKYADLSATGNWIDLQVHDLKIAPYHTVMMTAYTDTYEYTNTLTVHLLWLENERQCK